MLKTISNSAENMRSSSRVHDENNQKIQQLKNSLNQESHLIKNHIRISKNEKDLHSG